MKQLVIGHNEYIRLPGYGVDAPVPAKIDTGADGSAIWASSISEDETGLHFHLFDNGSVYFTNRQIDTREYKTKRIKNSFGVTEVRYSVKLSFKLGGKGYKAWFSLANRANNHFPILLGRKFLKNRFLVDVSQHHLLSDDIAPNKVLILVEYGTPKTVAYFKRLEQSSGAHFTVSNYKPLVFSTVGSLTVKLGVDGTDVVDHKMVYLKSHIANSEMAGALATYLNYRNVIFSDTEHSGAVSQGKLAETIKLTAFDVPTPPMVAMKQPQMIKHYDYLAAQFGGPFVLKDAMANKGRSNYFITNEADFIRVLTESEETTLFMAQKFVPNNGYTRVLIFGNSHHLVISRTAAKHKDPLKAHLNNPFGGDNAKVVKSDEADSIMLEIAHRAAFIMQRQIAGVDMIQDTQTGQWFVLEVNNNPQILTGSFREEKAEAFAKYIKTELDRW